MKFLGVDYGSRKVGVAISDELGRFSFPYAVFATSPVIYNELKVICENEKINKVVIGESLNYQGEPNTIMAEIIDFKNKLAKATFLPVVFHPEVLSTKQALRIQEKDEMVDARAAALILQSYLDSFAPPPQL